MKIAILDKVVRENVAMFQHLVQKFLRTKKLQYLTDKKTYKAFINCKTGQLKFADLDQRPLNEDWKPIIIELRPLEKDEGFFDVVWEENSEQFSLRELNPEAYARLGRTIHVLNQLAFDPIIGKSFERILKRIAQLTFEFTELEEGRKNLVHEAWHLVDRIEAERLLKDLPNGTYLFRKDPFAQTLEEELNKGFADPIICITLTHKDQEGKICDKTLVYKNGNWLLYNDDPTLSEKTFPTVKALLATMADILKNPLLQ